MGQISSHNKPAGADKSDLPKAYSSEEIFGDNRMVLISHGDTVYRLQITNQKKLILTK